MNERRESRRERGREIRERENWKMKMRSGEERGDGRVYIFKREREEREMNGYNLE